MPILNPDAGPEEPLRIILEDAPAEGNATAETEAAAGGAATSTSPPPQPTGTETAPAVGIEDLKRQLAQTKQQRDQAAVAARQLAVQRDQAAAIAAEAQRRGISGDEVVVETRLAAAQQELDALTEAQATAFESGDWKKVAEINAKMNRSGGAIALLEAQKAGLENQRQQFLAQQQQQAVAAQQRAIAAQQAPRDPVEAFLATRTAPTAQFMRTHKDKIFRPDGSFKRAAVDAHEAALDAGHGIDTNQYFDFVEKALNGGTGNTEVRTRQPNAQPPKPKGPPSEAAPVSRGTVTGTPGARGTEYMMTPHMRQLAHEQMGSDTREAELEWFTNYLAAVKAGRMEPITQ